MRQHRKMEKSIFGVMKTAIARTNMWLRVADRVRIIAGEFHADDVR